MAQYRKKPVVIDAVQFTKEIAESGNVFRFQYDHDGKVVVSDFVIYSNVGNVPNEKSLQITTLEGTMRASVGDWVIRGINGEFYPCKPDIFDKTYEAV
jgi:hypothetical protein